GRAADHAAESFLGPELGPKNAVLGGKIHVSFSLPQLELQLLQVEFLFQVIVSATSHGFDGFRYFGEAGHHDHDYLWVTTTDLLQHLDAAVAAGKAHVEQDKIYDL